MSWAVSVADKCHSSAPEAFAQPSMNAALARATASNSAWVGVRSIGISAVGAVAGSHLMGLLLPMPRGSKVTTSY